MNARLKQRALNGFTLIELLVVMVVIAILAALVLRVANYVQIRAAVAQCKVEMVMLTSAVDEYFKLTGRYPATMDAFFDALINEQVAQIDWPADRIANKRFLDPWGTPYNYRLSVDYSPDKPFMLERNRTFEIKSFGPDRLDGTLDDVAVEQAPLN